MCFNVQMLYCCNDRLLSGNNEHTRGFCVRRGKLNSLKGKYKSCLFKFTIIQRKKQELCRRWNWKDWKRNVGDVLNLWLTFIHVFYSTGMSISLTASLKHMQFVCLLATWPTVPPSFMMLCDSIQKLSAFLREATPRFGQSVWGINQFFLGQWSTFPPSFMQNSHLNFRDILLTNRQNGAKI